MRVLLRRLKQQGWRFDRPVWKIDEQGVGLATYRAIGPERTYTLVAFAHDLPDDVGGFGEGRDGEGGRTSQRGAARWHVHAARDVEEGSNAPTHPPLHRPQKRLLNIELQGQEEALS